MKDDKLVFLDTNILIYYYENNNEIKKLKAEKLINQCWNREINLVLSNQTLAEFSSLALRKLKLLPEQIKEIIDDINKFSNFIKINYSSTTISKAILLTKEYQIHFWDALIIATMKENGLSKIYTENVKDFKSAGINAVNPFE